MDYKALYNQKLTNAAAIAAQVQDNWVLGMDAGIAQTPAIMSAIAVIIQQNQYVHPVT